MNRAVIVTAKRTPIGKIGGMLKDTPPEQLAAHVLKALVEDIDLVEFNEAFASQVLASIRTLKIPIEKVNRGGGAIAIGHPYGASGAILVTRLVSEMKRSNDKRAMATLGIGGGSSIKSFVK